MGLDNYGFGNTYKTNWMGLFFLVLIAITISRHALRPHRHQGEIRGTLRLDTVC